MVARYVRGCDVCHRIKPANTKPFGKLEQLEIPEERWSRIGIDFITKLPVSTAGYDCIITIIDHLTKRAHFLPATESGLTAEGFATIFCNFYVRLHGVPDVIVSDQDPRFLSEFWQSLMKILKTRLGMSSPYHPETEGQTEKANHIISTYLRAFARHRPDTWDELLPLGEFAYNASTHASTGKTPFELDLGYTPRMPIDRDIRREVAGTRESGKSSVTFIDKLRDNLELARESLKVAQDTQKALADQDRQEVPFQVGQKVYLSTRNLPLTYSNASDQRSRKLQDLYDGPFTITKSSRSPNAWYLDLPATWNIKQPLNASLFKRDNSDPSRPRLPPPVKQSIYGAEYLVEEVVGHRDSGNNRLYRLRWTGWDKNSDTWEPLSALENCSDLVEEYHRKQEWGPPLWPRKGKRKRRKTEKALEADIG